MIFISTDNLGRFPNECSFFPFRIAQSDTIIYTKYYLSPVGHATTLHSLKLFAQTSLLDLSLLLFLRVFKVSHVTKFHQVSTLADLPLESTKGTFDGLSITHHNLNTDTEGSAWTFWNNQKREKEVRFFSFSAKVMRSFTLLRASSQRKPRISISFSVVASHRHERNSTLFYEPVRITVSYCI